MLSGALHVHGQKHTFKIPLYSLYIYIYTYCNNNNNILYIYIFLGVVLLPVTVSKQLFLFLNKAFTNHHHPLLQVLGQTH